jgi:hypothetical protein
MPSAPLVSPALWERIPAAAQAPIRAREARIERGGPSQASGEALQAQARQMCPSAIGAGTGRWPLRPLPGRRSPRGRR